MDNLEWLKSLKKEDTGFQSILKQAEEERSYDPKVLQDWKISYRKVRALEIIAEELINLNNNSGSITTALENIETTINQRLKY